MGEIGLFKNLNKSLDIVNVLNFSGGKDSMAMLLLALERKRADLLEIEEVTDVPALDGLVNYRPILQWKAEDCFAMHEKHNIKPNPLYKLGMKRVGCMPCINCGKAELREIANRFTEHVDRIREWEMLVMESSKHGKASFFAYDRTPEKYGPGIDETVKWSKTSRGGKLKSLFSELEPKTCSSQYGLCE